MNGQQLTALRKNVHWTLIAQSIGTRRLTDTAYVLGLVYND